MILYLEHSQTFLSLINQMIFEPSSSIESKVIICINRYKRIGIKESSSCCILKLASQRHIIYNGAAHNTYYNCPLTAIKNRKRESNETPKKKILLDEKLKQAGNGPNQHPSNGFIF